MKKTILFSLFLAIVGLQTDLLMAMNKRTKNDSVESTQELKGNSPKKLAVICFDKVLNAVIDEQIGLTDALNGMPLTEELAEQLRLRYVELVSHIQTEADLDTILSYIDPNESVIDGQPLLTYLLANKKLQLAYILLFKHSDALELTVVDSYGRSALIYAIRAQSYEMTYHILDVLECRNQLSSINNGQWDAFLAACKYFPHAIELLIAKGIDCENSGNKGLKAFVNNIGERAERAASKTMYQFGCFKKLVHATDSALINGYDLLTDTILYGNAQMLKKLVKRGIDPNYSKKPKDMPIYIAIATGELEKVKLLVECGADLSPVKKMSPLTYAIKRYKRASEDSSYAYFQIIEFLSKNGSVMNKNLKQAQDHPELSKLLQ